MKINIDQVMVEAFKLEQEDVSAIRIVFEDGQVKIGASDLPCPRKTGFNIMFGPVIRALSQSILMKKGNVGEEIFADNLKTMGIKYETQGHYHGPNELDFIQVHPDFLIDVNDPGNPVGEAKKMIDDAKKAGIKYILIELKTSNAVPSEPHGYWIQQVNLQHDYISIAKGIKQEELSAKLYVMELDYGRHGMFDIPFDPAEVALAEKGAVSLYNVITEFVQFANGEIEEMTSTVFDIDATYGELCNMCDWTDMCFKEKQNVDLPKELEIYALELKEYKEKDKNMKAKGEELKQFMKNGGVKRATSEGMTLSIRGGNEKDIVDVDSVPDEKMNELWKANMRVFVLNETLFSKLEPKRHKEMLNDHRGTKVTAESLILKRNA